MISLFLLAAGVVVIVLSRSLGQVPLPGGGRASGLAGDALGVLLLLLGLGGSSFVVVGADQVGHLQRVYLGRSMPQGRVLALAGENGPQASVLAPGFHFMPLVRVLYRIELLPVTEVPPGSYGLLAARDGKPLPGTEYLARGWPEDQTEQMLDASYFLTHGGQRGPQLSVLKPGRYRLNRYLFDVRLAAALDVPKGYVAVIKSNVNEHADCAEADVRYTDSAHAGLAVPLVKKGCVGVWETPLLPNRYYLNEMAYTPTLIPTQVQTWNYKGGYSTRQINVTVASDGRTPCSGPPCPGS